MAHSQCLDRESEGSYEDAPSMIRFGKSVATLPNSLSPKLCKQRGTTQVAVKDAYQQLLDGLVRPTTALRIAGLLPPSKTASKSIYMVKDPKEAAKRILKVVGQNNAAEIADQLKMLLAS